MYKYNSNQVYNSKNIKTAHQQKRTAKKELQQVIKTKNNMVIKLKNNQYRISQEYLKKIITHYEPEAAQKKLNNIYNSNEYKYNKYNKYDSKWKYKLQTILELSKKY